MTKASHAVVLSGGGANGAYEIGVMEALFAGRGHRGSLPAVQPAVFVGTSVGAFNAAAMVSLPTWGWVAAARKLRDIWLDRVATRGGQNGVFRVRFMGGQLPRDVAELTAAWVPRTLDLALSGDPPLRRLFRLVDGEDVISTAPLEALIADTIVPARLTQSETMLKIATCNWDTGDAVVFRNHDDPGNPRRSKTPAYKREKLTEENIPEVVLASTAIPAVFPRVRIGSEYFVDGGVVMNTPLVPALHAGATVIHVIHMEPKLRPLPFGHAPSAFESLERILMATPARLIDSDIRQASLINELATTDAGRARGWRPVEIHRYFPRQEIGGVIGLLDFDRTRLAQLIEHGFRDAVEHDCARNNCVVVAREPSDRLRAISVSAATVVGSMTEGV